MVNVNTDNLEKALSSGAVNEQPKQSSQPQMPKETEIGFHQGALNTLVAERNELFKMIQNVEAIMQMHLKRLEELGVKVPKQAGK